MELSLIEQYVKFIEDLRKRYDHMGELIVRDVIHPEEINRALGNYYHVSSGILSEYRRKKIESEEFKLEYLEWYDLKFEAARKEVICEYSSVKGAVKPAIKEFETRLRINNRTQYNVFQKKMILLHAETRHYSSLRYRIGAYGKILETICDNMRSELFALSVQSKANKKNVPKRILVETTE